MNAATPPLLVFGRRGQMAEELVRRGVTLDKPVVAFGRESVDISNRDAVMRAVEASPAPVVVNAAAWTGVDKAETESDGAYAVNRDGAANIAEACAAHDRALIHISTDYVFNGKDPGHPWREDDAVAPLSVYGASKLAGERAIEAVLARHIIVRTSWLFAGHGQSFVRTMLRLGQQRPVVSVVSDQHGCPTPASDLAGAIMTMADGIQRGTAAYGLFHYCGAEPTTWFGFAEAIFAEAAAQGLRTPQVRSILTRDYPTPATRPLMSVLDCSRIEKSWGIVQRPWRRALPRCIRALATEVKELQP